MNASSAWFAASDGAELFVQTWEPEAGTAAVAVLHIHHGMAEHCGRYERFAVDATQKGLIVVAHDARAHGKTAERANNNPVLGHAELGALGALRLVEDMKELIGASRSTHPGLPLLVLGHSLGSMVSQLVTGSGIGVQVEGVVLSGPPARSSAVELFALDGVISGLSAVQGASACSSIPHKLIFEKYQKNLLKRAKCAEVSGFEWLNRDAEECKKYVDDPHCGQLMSNGWYKGLVLLMKGLNTPAAVPPAKVPVLVIQGESDTCGINDFGTYSFSQIQALFSGAPRHLPPKVVLYPNARHELLNETCRDEVTHDVLEFLVACSGAGARSRL